MIKQFVAFMAGSCLASLVLATDRPTIGIVSLELEGILASKFPDYHSYIVASYVKAVESSGARAVPVFIGQTKEYYRKTFNSINGLVIPGGGAYFNGTNNYYSTSKILYHMAMKANRKHKEKFPILGICLGFELLLILATEHGSGHEKEIRKRCDLKNVNLALQFEPNFRKSSLFRHTSKRVINTLQSNITINYHQWCIYPKAFQDVHLDAHWNVLSTTLDKSKAPFISSVEHKRFPVAGVQFHPEKHLFEWSTKKNYPHSSKSVEVTRHFFDWLVEQSRLNNHSFPNSQEESSALIYNYSPVYSDLYNVSYTQMYVFKKLPAEEIETFEIEVEGPSSLEANQPLLT